MNQLKLTEFDRLREENPELPVFFAYVNDKVAWQTVVPAKGLYTKLSDYAVTSRGLLLDSHNEATEEDIAFKIYRDPRGPLLSWGKSVASARNEIAEADWKPCILVVLI